MNDLLSDLAAALRDRLAIIGDQESRRDAPKHMTRLQAVSERIETLQNELPTTTDARLKHFLQQRSYDKALEWIETNAAA